jgi:ATP-binding cassette subfamily E protein 1
MHTVRLPVPRPGQVLGLVGTNGIGKSTALKVRVIAWGDDSYGDQEGHSVHCQINIILMFIWAMC